VELAVEGVFELPKAAGDALAQCEAVFWDNVAKRVTGSNNTAGTLPQIGAATEAALAADATARIRLNGTTV
jgi:predicted RecA/RadA family phage recombinase